MKSKPRTKTNGLGVVSEAAPRKFVDQGWIRAQQRTSLAVR